MDRESVPARVDDKKTSTRHRPVQLHRLSDMSQREQANSTFQGTVSRECSGQVQSGSPAMSPPYLGPSLVTVQLFKGVFYKPEDFETGGTSSNQPQHVTQEQANDTSPLSSTDTLMDSSHSQSYTVTALSLPSTSSHHNRKDVSSNYKNQPTVNGQSSKRKLYESESEVDDDDSIQWLDDGHENEVLSPQVKKPRMDTTRPDCAQPKVARQSQRQPPEDEDQKELDKQDGQVITLVLQCPEWNCSQLFTTNQHTTAVNQLNHHLKVVHSIGLSRCMVLFCGESFPNRYLLGQHIKKFHAGIVEWHCSKCLKHYPSYQMLFQHKMGHHKLGIFQCSFPECSFTGQYKTKVKSHYALEHTNMPELECQAKSGCTYRTTIPSLLMEHERVHLSVKPFRCDWPNCHLSCASRSNTMSHIKKVHFKSKTCSSKDEVALIGKPADNLSVDRSLLLKHRLYLSTFKQ